MGASESSESPRIVRRRNDEEPDQFHVLRVRAERNEIDIGGGRRLETRRVNVVSATGSSGGRVEVHQQERVQVRMQLPSSGSGQQLEWREPRRLALLSNDSTDNEESDNGYGCTYDGDGPGYMLQPWFKCKTCWGPGAGDSAFGCCSHCANTCHRGHDLQRCDLANAECDCGQNKHQTAVCTWNVTKRNYIKQPFYHCRDCFSLPVGGVGDGMCYQCWKICHRTHNTTYLGVIKAFCDCGLSSCRIKCSIPGPK